MLMFLFRLLLPRVSSLSCSVNYSSSALVVVVVALLLLLLLCRRRRRRDIYLSTCLSVCLSVRVSVCLSLSIICIFCLVGCLVSMYKVWSEAFVFEDDSYTQFSQIS